MSYGYKKGYNPQKYAENRKAEKERTYQMIDDTAIEVSRSPDKLKEFLAVQAKFDMYSAANTLLIFKQMPNATQLKSFEDWNKDGVQVRQKQKSIAILEPVEYTKSDGTPGLGYNVKRVFDRLQTNSKREAVQKTDDLKHTLKNFVNASPVEIVVGEIPNSNLGAFYNFETQQITLNENLTDTKQIFECLAQEVAFAQLADGKKSYSRRDEGFKAVCLAYMICTKYGVDKNAFAIENLPDNWKKADVKDIRRELSSVNSAYKEIVSRVNDEIYRQRQAKSKEMER